MSLLLYEAPVLVLAAFLSHHESFMKSKSLPTQETTGLEERPVLSCVGRG